MVEKLNELQIKAMATTKEEYLAKGLSTEPLPPEQELLEKFAHVYACGGIRPPKEVITAGSPYEIVEAYYLLAKRLELPKKDQLKPEEVVNNMCYGSTDAGWLSYYGYFRAHVPEVTGIDKVDGLISLLGKVGFFLPLENYVIVARNPLEIHMVDGRLHNTSGPAIKFEGGGQSDCYSLYGTPVDKTVIDLVVSGDAKGVLKIKNVDQRVVALKALGAEEILKSIGGESISSKGDEYELFKVYIEGRENRLLKMKNPSEPKTHYEFVDPRANTVSQALAWRIGWDIDGVFSEPKAKT